MSDEALNARLDWLDDCAEEQRSEAVTWADELEFALSDEVFREKSVLQMNPDVIRDGISIMRNLETENAALKQLCAEAYQVVGALNGPVNLLDNLSAGAQGEPMPHTTVLPFSQEVSGEKEKSVFP